MFLYLTVISKGADEAPDLTSTHLETNITHLTPPCKPGEETAGTNAQPVALQFLVERGSGADL